MELRRDYFGGMRFNDNYDWDNIWYDAVQVSADTLLLIGPPMNNTAQLIANKIGITDADGNLLQGRFIPMDRAQLTVIQTPRWLDRVNMISEVVTPIAVHRLDDRFNGKRVIFTLQKDNPVSWIKQWAIYHRDTLGADGILIYDNGSRAYTAEQLELSLAIPDIIVAVVRWDVPYGPQGFDCNYYNTWDSDYAQSTMFEHAKRRYLHCASIAVNADIDELVVAPGRTLGTIASDLNTRGIAGYTYKGRWIEPYDVKNGRDARQIPHDQRRFYDYHCTDHTNPRDLGNKWMLIPAKSMEHQWLVHHTTAPMEHNTDIYYGHYLAMNTNWSYPRDAYDRDPANLVSDLHLMQNLTSIKDNT